MSDTNLFAPPSRLRRLQIEITTGCNLQCVGCQRTIGMAGGTWRNAHMPMARFAAVLRHAPPADVIILQGIGEPTLHPALPDMIEAARAAGKFGLVSFNTNALAREPDWYVCLRQVGLGHISISVDSLVPETAAALRGGTDCAQLRAAIPALIRLFEGAVTLSIVLSRRNVDEVPALLATLHGFGARTIEVQPLVSYAAAIDPLALDKAALRGASVAIEAARRGLPGLTVLQGAALTPNGSRCRRPFHAAYVTVEGFLTPCCVTNDTSLFGRTSLVEQPFEAAWQSPGVRRFLSAYFDREPEICRGCAFNPSGATVSLDEARRLHQAGALDQAEAAFRQAVDEGEALHSLGLLRFQRGDPAGALPLLRAAVALGTGARLTHNLATVLHQLGEVEQALALQRRNLAEHPGYEPSYQALTALLQARGDASAAAAVQIALGERALAAGAADTMRTAVARVAALDPLHPGLLHFASRLRIAGHADQALLLLQARLTCDPDDLAAALAQTMSRLTVIHASTEDIEARRRAYIADLDALEARVEGLPQVRPLREGGGAATALIRAAEQVGTSKPFYLAYQGHDDRDLQRRYGQIVSRMMAAAHPTPAPHPARPAPHIRVGFATAYFHLHSVSKLFGGWLRALDRGRFAVFGYHLGDAEDATSLALAACCERFHRGARSDSEWTAIIAADAPHVLIYPEIGMHPTAVRLACRRLAPIQCVAWGHPVTTGLPEIDYFLSSDLMEPPDGATHYAERLVRLPNLSICYEALPVTRGMLDRAALGLRTDAVVYVCCQSLFKYHPRDDALLPEIAARVPQAQFLFIGDPREANMRLLRVRLDGAFAAAGLDAGRFLVFVPPVSADAFPALLRVGDVYLDSLGWSGGNTTLEAIACDLPVVTCPGPLMRGRHSSAILRMMGLEQWIAETVDGYVSLAVALAEPVERERMRASVRAGRHRLYGDTTPVRALETFLARAVDIGRQAEIGAMVSG